MTMPSPSAADLLHLILNILCPNGKINRMTVRQHWWYPVAQQECQAKVTLRLPEPVNTEAHLAQ